ncbi:hypothetical protein [Noviherbaspirillum massiliense]|uniref:hypothetical protein n=1 Tax=Noviherbaspirillum massiliense TaxID=1465823 RepID=UPI00031BDF3A|nr:hypothetical protein [Noviherbaspirillum massiliense]
MVLTDLPLVSLRFDNSLQFLRWLIPRTAAIHAALRLNRIGATLADVLPYLGIAFAILPGIKTRRAAGTQTN